MKKIICRAVVWAAIFGAAFVAAPHVADLVGGAVDQMLTQRENEASRVQP